MGKNVHFYYIGLFLRSEELVDLTQMYVITFSFWFALCLHVIFLGLVFWMMSLHFKSLFRLPIPYQYAIVSIFCFETIMLCLLGLACIHYSSDILLCLQC